jgi:hypothetical protein
MSTRLNMPVFFLSAQLRMAIYKSDLVSLEGVK